MAFGGFSDNTHSTPMADINVTPMVDVMLVLVVIFIITAPLYTHSIKLDLPTAQSAPAPEKPQTVTVSIDGKGQVFWENDAVDDATLTAKLAEAAKKQPQPELQLRADKATRYEVIAKVMAAAQNGGVSKMGFVTTPPTDANAPATPNNGSSAAAAASSPASSPAASVPAAAKPK